MSLSAELDKAIQQGMNPEVTISIPINLDRVNRHVEITKNRMILIGGEPTAAKTTMAQTTFITDPIEWYLRNKPKGMKLSVISFLMERKMVEYTARWIAKKIFEDMGEDIPSKRILGRDRDISGREKRLTKGEYELVNSYYTMLDEWEADDLLIASQGSKNPTGIKIFIDEFAKKHGRIHKKDWSDKSMDNILATDVYEPNHPNHIVLIIGDNASVLDQEQDLTQKGLVDKFNRTMMHSRDVYGFSPVLVQHLNREVSSAQRQRLGDLKPKLSDFADSAMTQKCADVVFGLLNPSSHITKESGHSYLGYDLNKMTDDNSLNYFRSLHILKNNFGAENVSYPLGIHPVYGILKILPKTTADTPVPDSLYDQVTSGSWFLEKEELEYQSKKAISLNKSM